MPASSMPIRQLVHVASCTCCITVALARAWAFQQPLPQRPTFQSESNEVGVVVIVRDAKGQAIGNLKQSDFEIRDNGEPQTISSFAVQTMAQQDALVDSATAQSASDASTAHDSKILQRRFLGLFFDDVHAAVGDFGRVQKAAEQFVQKSLQPGDRVAIFKTSGNSDIVFTNDKSKLIAAIDALRIHPRENASSVRQCPRMSGYEAYLIVSQYDPEAWEIVALRLQNCTCPPPAADCPPISDFKVMTQAYAQETWQTEKSASRNLLSGLDLAVRALETMPGRRMLVLSSSGFLTGDLDRDVGDVIDDALRGGVVINALSAKGLSVEPPGGNLGDQRIDGTFSVSPQVSRYEARQLGAQADAETAAMVDFVEGTGGRFFKNNNDLLRGFNDLAMRETSYSLYFSPHRLKPDGKFHKLKIRLKTSGQFTIYTRKGYFAPTEKEAAAGRVNPLTSLAPTEKISAGPRVPATTPADLGRLAEAKDSTAEEDLGKTAPVGGNIVSSQPLSLTNTSPGVSSVTVKPASPELAAEIVFLGRASRETEHYIEAFADLASDETRVMQSFDEHGLQAQQKSIESELIVYRLRSDPKRVMEYRDVVSVDRHEIKDHRDRALRMWREVGESHSPEQEIRRIMSESERYDIGLSETGFTLFEGVPLRSLCAGDFAFHEVRREVTDGHSVRVFAYRQMRPCNVVTYHFFLPLEFAGSQLVQSGELYIDAESGQIVLEERNVYAANRNGKSPRVAHIVLAYGQSPFGILVPTTIVLETFSPQKTITGSSTDFRLQERMVQTYGPFSRFEVSTSEKVSAEKQ